MSGKEASDNEDTEETVTIMQEVKAADKIKILDEIELNESDSEENDIVSKSSSINSTSGKSTARNFHLDMNSYKCKECNKSFQNNMKFRQHMEGAHKKLKLFKCNDCEGSFSSEEKFAKHMAKHQSLPFKCKYCTRSFGYQWGLKYHVTKKHGEKRLLL